MNVAVIPARGGSKRIPRKNVKLFNGRPMLGYAIEAALRSGCIDRVIVSTDDEEIAATARACGAETPFLRPAHLSDDHTHIGAVIRHALGWLNENHAAPEWVCVLFATAPFLTPDILREGLVRLQRAPGKDVAIGVARFPFPIQRAVRITDDGGLEPFQPDAMSKRSQDLEEAFHDAGQFFWARPQALLNGTSVFSPRSIPVIIPAHRVQDIDTPEDWVRAEILYRALQLAEAPHADHLPG